MVQEYNTHMGGVDLWDMFLALFRVRVRSTKFQMYIVYYCVGVAITNEWLIYRRYCDQKKISKKKQIDLCTFQSRIAKALLLGKKEQQTPKRSHLSTITNDKKRNVVANPILVVDVRYERVGHFPVFTDKSVSDITLVVIRTFPVQNTKFNSVCLKAEPAFCNFIVNK